MLIERKSLPYLSLSLSLALSINSFDQSMMIIEMLLLSCRKLTKYIHFEIILVTVKKSCCMRRCFQHLHCEQILTNGEQREQRRSKLSYTQKLNCGRGGDRKTS